MSNHVVVLLSAKTCGGCKTLMRNWPSLESDIEKTGVRFINVSLTKIGESIDNRYPVDFRRRWTGQNAWYPMIFIFTKESWDNASANSSGKLEGKIYNGRLTSSGPAPTMDAIPDKRGALKFIDDNTKSSIDTPILTLLSESSSSSSSTTPKPAVKTQRAGAGSYALPTSGCQLRIVSKK